MNVSIKLKISLFCLVILVINLAYAINEQNKKVVSNADAQIKLELKKLLSKKDYTTFVEKLGEDIKDPKFLALLRAGKKDKDPNDDKVEFSYGVSYACKDLIPMQNEIDVGKSLKYPLSTDSSMIPEYLKGGVFSPAGIPIVTVGGKYIIDGHHRWSQMFLINPEAKIAAINMELADPEKALRIAQLAIAAVSGKISSSLVLGENLLTMTKDDFAMWIKSNISQNAIKNFAKAGIKSVEAIIEYIWENAQKMKKCNAPIKNASNRGYMPQTDTAPDWDKELKEGIVNISMPF